MIRTRSCNLSVGEFPAGTGVDDRTDFSIRSAPNRDPAVRPCREHMEQA